jgi:Tol biopolymer transport system component
MRRSVSTAQAVLEWSKEHDVTIQPGSELGAYTILGSIATPGSTMGEGALWRARDSRQGREVAIRTFPPPIAGDQERIARMGAAARRLAAFDHPGAARVYGLEESDGMPFLVTELVEGETLAERLRRGAIPVAEGLGLALQVAHALEAAHESGVLHCDLNPSQIRLTPNGGVKILDVGLPGLLGTDDAATASDPNISHSPTRAVTTVRSGSFSGSSAYRPPEQARGEVPDARADIWGFGCVLFEILAGRTPFHGKTESDVRAAVLKSDPDWTRLPADVHPRIRLLLERCFEKDAARRPSDMAGVRADVAKTLENPEGAAAVGRAAHRAWLLPWAVAVVGAAAIGLAVSWALRPDAPSPIVRFQMWASQPGGVTAFLQAISPELAISPDGARIAFKGMDGRLYLRDRDDMTSRPLQITGQTRTLHAPLFSPDGREVYFIDVPPGDGPPAQIAAVLPRLLTLSQIPEPGLDLKKVPVDGGAPTPVLTGRRDEVLDPAWSGNGTILFADSRGIQSVPANGGTPTTLLETPGAQHPQMLPGGQWLLYSTGDLVNILARGASATAAQIVVQSLADPKERRVVWEGGVAARYVGATGHIIYQGVTKPGLWAFPFDAARLEKTGDPVPLVEGLIVDYALSDTGALAYAAALGVALPTVGSDTSGSVLAIVARSGGIARRLRVDPGLYRNPRVSPDGSRVAYAFVDASGESHIWVYDLGEDFPRKLTSQGENRNPIWKGDRSVTYASKRDGTWGVYTESADGSGEAESVVAAPKGTIYRPQAWAPDGALVLVGAAEEAGARTGRLFLLPANADGKVREIAPAEPGADEYGASLSPDGAWLAYIARCATPLGGCARVQRFPPVPGSSFLVSQNEAWVQFSPDGKQLLTNRPNFYDARDVASKGTSVAFENPRRFNFNGFQGALDDRSLDLRGPAGTEFVMVVPVATPAGRGAQGNPTASSRIGFVHNFYQVLKERVRASGGQ